MLFSKIDWLGMLNSGGVLTTKESVLRSLLPLESLANQVTLCLPKIEDVLVSNVKL